MSETNMSSLSSTDQATSMTATVNNYARKNTERASTADASFESILAQQFDAMPLATKAISETTILQKTEPTLTPTTEKNKTLDVLKNEDVLNPTLPESTSPHANEAAITLLSILQTPAAIIPSELPKSEATNSKSSLEVVRNQEGKAQTAPQPVGLKTELVPNEPAVSSTPAAPSWVTATRPLGKAIQTAIRSEQLVTPLSTTTQTSKIITEPDSANHPTINASLVASSMSEKIDVLSANFGTPTSIHRTTPAETDRTTFTRPTGNNPIPPQDKAVSPRDALKIETALHSARGVQTAPQPVGLKPDLVPNEPAVSDTPVVPTWVAATRPLAKAIQAAIRSEQLVTPLSTTTQTSKVITEPDSANRPTINAPLVASSMSEKIDVLPENFSSPTSIHRTTPAETDRTTFTHLTSNNPIPPQDKVVSPRDALKIETALHPARAVQTTPQPVGLKTELVPNEQSGINPKYPSVKSSFQTASSSVKMSDQSISRPAREGAGAFIAQGVSVTNATVNDAAILLPVGEEGSPAYSVSSITPLPQGRAATASTSSTELLKHRLPTAAIATAPNHQTDITPTVPRSINLNSLPTELPVTNNLSSIERTQNQAVVASAEAQPIGMKFNLPPDEKAVLSLLTTPSDASVTSLTPHTSDAVNQPSAAPALTTKSSSEMGIMAQHHDELTSVTTQSIAPPAKLTTTSATTISIEVIGNEPSATVQPMDNAQKPLSTSATSNTQAATTATQNEPAYATNKHTEGEKPPVSRVAQNNEVAQQATVVSHQNPRVDTPTTKQGATLDINGLNISSIASDRSPQTAQITEPFIPSIESTDTPKRVSTKLSNATPLTATHRSEQPQPSMVLSTNKPVQTTQTAELKNIIGNPPFTAAPVAAREPLSGTSNVSSTVQQSTPTSTDNAALLVSAMRTVTPPASNIIQTAIHAPVGSRAWPDEFTQQVTMISKSNHQVAELHLNPAELGPINVVLKMADNQISAAFTSPHSAVRAAIENSLPQLRDILANSGLSLGNTSVNDQAARDNGASAFMNQRYPSAKTEGIGGSARLANVAPSIQQPLVNKRLKGAVDTFA